MLIYASQRVPRMQNILTIAIKLMVLLNLIPFMKCFMKLGTNADALSQKRRQKFS